MYKIDLSNYSLMSVFNPKTGEILFSSERTYLETTEGRMNYLLLEKEPIQAKKKNLFRDEVFSLVERQEYQWRKPRNLYIPSSIIDCSSPVEKLSANFYDEKNYKLEYLFTFSLPQILPSRRIEEVNGNDPLTKGEEVWQSRRNNKWYKTIYFDKEVMNVTIESDYYTRTEKNDFRVKCEQLANEWNELLKKDSFSYYSISEILKKYDVRNKEEEEEQEEKTE